MSDNLLAQWMNCGPIPDPKIPEGYEIKSRIGDDIVIGPIETGDKMSNHKDRPIKDRTSVRCWFGGCCDALAVYDVVHGHEAFGPKRHSVCEMHLTEMVSFALRKVSGWGNPIPAVITVRENVK